MHVLLVLPIGGAMVKLFARLSGHLGIYLVYQQKTLWFRLIFSIVFQLPFQVRKSMARIKVVIAERVSRVESYRGP